MTDFHPIKVGLHGGCIVSDKPMAGVRGFDEVEYYGGFLVAESMTAENARRAVACWNACSGVATDSLEKTGRLHLAVGHEFDYLARQRDELLAALKQIRSTHPRSGMDPNAKVGAVDAIKWNVHMIADEAIAKVEGGVTCAE